MDIDAIFSSCNNGTSYIQLSFGGDLDHSLDPVIFKGIFYHQCIPK